MSFEMRALNAEEEGARQSALDLAGRLIGAEPPFNADQVQALYRVIRDEHPDYLEGSIAVGIAFGELIVAEAAYEWVRVIDEYGSETSLAPVGYDGVCHPISMIQKRIDCAEDFDVRDLRDDTIYTIGRRIEDGRCAPR